MDWKTLFLTADGRIGKRDFWIGFLIVFVGTMALSMVPVLGGLAVLASHYPTICLTSKRLHDFGRSGWLSAVPYALAFVTLIVGALTGGMALLGIVVASETAAAGAAMAGLGLFSALIGLTSLIWFGFLLWVGLTNGEVNENRYGPPPVSLIGGASPPTVA
jgi:uncharacterized membrane protein YhaH (DUF805 family)